MTLPYQQTTIQDPGLAKVRPISNVPLILGVAASGTPYEVTSFNSPSEARSTFGEGPLTEGLCAYLTLVGGPVLACLMDQAADGSLTATFAKSGTGPDITDNSSAPYDWYEVVGDVVVGGDIGTATVKWSLDGGRTFMEPVVAAATYTIPNSGIDIAMAAGTYVAGDRYTATATGPTYSATEMDSAFAAVKTCGLEWDFGCLTGRHADISTATTIGNALAADFGALPEPYSYKPWIMDAGGDNKATTIAGVSRISKHITMVYGTVDMVSQKPNPGYISPALPGYIQGLYKAGKELMSTHWGRVASGQLPGVAAFSTEFGSPLSHDEFQDQGLDAVGLATLRTWPGLPGVYFTRGKMLAPVGSDFVQWPLARIFSEVHRVVHEAQTTMQNRSWAVKADGTLVESEAAAAEQKVRKVMKALLHQKNAEGTLGHCSINGKDPGFFYTLSRTQDVQSTNTIVFAWGVRPRPFGEIITGTGGFTATTA